MSDEEDRLLSEAAADEEQIVGTLADELRKALFDYYQGDMEFDELTFEVFDTLQAIHAVRAGSYRIEYVDEAEASADLEDRTQEPPRQKPKRSGRGRRRS
ncbi:MAG: hypothetical protein QJR03_14345 [Sphaerobacter sp.]|nr:hypothetical protein [Sphaerobacter sp.]